MPQEYSRLITADSDASPIKVASIGSASAGYGLGLIMAIETARADFVHTQIGSDTQDDIQTLTFPTPFVSGTYKLSLPEETTTALSWNANRAQIQAAADKLLTVGNGMIVVSGNGPFIFTTKKRKMDDFSIDISKIDTGSPIWVPTRSQVKYYEALGSQTLGYSAGILYSSQVIELTKATSTGTMTLRFQNQDSAAIPYNATASQVAAALASWTNVGPSEIAVVGGQLPSKSIMIIFKGRYQFNNTPITVLTHSFGSTNTPKIYGAGKQLLVAKQSSSGKYLVIRTPFL